MLEVAQKRKTLTPAPQEEVELLIREADYDGDGTIDLQEFSAFMLSK